EMREGREPRFAEGVADDSLFRKAGMTREKIKAAISDTSELLGNAEEQIEVVAENAGRLINKYKKESAYEPRGIV
ncbi:adenylosuccinate lyase, partial [Candidatus Woesearchaeota archaeon CG10_big_fil_rev_8_21_14_0_10_47_5]